MAVDDNCGIWLLLPKNEIQRLAHMAQFSAACPWSP